MWEEHFNQYQLIAKTINQAYAFKSAENKNISSLISSKTFMSGTYSNVNDLCSADISGVSLAFAAFGGDLINLGRALDLTNINKFGLPSNLLNTLDKNNVTTATKTVEMALLLAGLSTQEIIEIKTPGYQPTKIQEASIYKAFTYVIDGDGGSDLSDVLAKLNCTTEGLASLADLLDPKKIFPTSYKTLTVPKYNIDRNITNSGKIYYLIYDNGGINTTQLQQLAQYFTVDLEGILSAELIMACGALSMSLQQVKNIRSMDIERFAPVVANLEVPNNGMPLLNQTNGIAVDPKLMDAAQQRSALGSGNGGQYRMCDFFGAACGFPYSTWYEQIQRLVPSIMSSTLTGYYSALDAQAATIDSATLTTMVAQIETEVTRIANANRVKADELNFYWTQIGRQLTVEQRAVALAYKNAEELSTGSSASDVENLMTQLETYALDSGVGQTATVLSGLADTSTVGGQSLVAALREARNAKRIQLAGGELNNNVQNYIDPCAASATATVVGGKITKVVVTNPSNGYTQAQLPSILVYPVNVKKQAVLVPVLAGGGIASVRIVDGGEGYDQDTIHVEIEEPPQCQYSAPAQQTYNDTPYSQLISPELVAPSDAIMTADEAIQSVITCNCDCWLE
jgi:hypothetical protein